MPGITLHSCVESLLIPLVGFAGSLITFYSGFGLGTILLPVFALFYPASEAIALTAIVHLLNNIFKLTLVGKHFSSAILIRFGIPSVLGASLGAALLTSLETLPVIMQYQLGEEVYSITTIKLIIGILMIVFAGFEIIPFFKNLQFSGKWLIPGGVLSGFFGGLSGHQGALRSAFLVRSGLSKESFIATGVFIACMVDSTRIISYANAGVFEIPSYRILSLLLVVLAAFAGALLGNYSLKKMTIKGVQVIVAIALAIIGFLLGLGII